MEDSKVENKNQENLTVEDCTNLHGDDIPNNASESNTSNNASKSNIQNIASESNIPNNASESNTPNNASESNTISKRQKKKLLKRQRWIESREERKKREREKQKRRLEAKRAAGELCGNMLRKRLKGATMAGSSCKQRVAVDMSFDDLMMEKHLVQCVKQISRCYGANRRVSDPMQFYITSFKGKCHDLMARQNGYMNWDVHFKNENYLDLFDKKDIVYLTSESSNTVSSLDNSKVYVIGGLVDHNDHKGLCYKLALEKGVSHARLPIDEFIEMKTRKVLSVDQVFKILLGVTQGKNWKDSFLEAIPPRKGAVGKETSDDKLSDAGCDGSDSSDFQSMPNSEAENGKINGETATKEVKS